MKALIVTCILIATCVGESQPKPFNTNVNTNYNYNTNFHTSYLISALLSYIVNLLQVLQKNSLKEGAESLTIPPFPRPDEILSLLPPPPPPPEPAKTLQVPDVNLQTPHTNDDTSFKAVRDSDKRKFHHKERTGEVMEAFRGPKVPPMVPMPVHPTGFWNHEAPQQVEDTPELKAAKREFFRAFAQAKNRGPPAPPSPFMEN